MTLGWTPSLKVSAGVCNAPPAMPSTEQNLSTPTEDSSVSGLCLAGGIAAFLQLVTLIGIMAVMATLGMRPTSVEDYFSLQQHSRLAAILRGDFLSLVMIALYLGTVPALYVSLRRAKPAGVAMAALFVLIGVVLCFATESTFALLHLGDQYAAAHSAVEKAEILAAGRAAVATDMWNSSGGYLCGILLQGGSIIMSVIMMRSRMFSRLTAYAGLFSNAIDLAQHAQRPFTHTVPVAAAILMGLFYLLWFPLLSRDLFRISRATRVPS